MEAVNREQVRTWGVPDDDSLAAKVRAAGELADDNEQLFTNGDWGKAEENNHRIFALLDEAQHSADARLLNAAPDLLAAVEDLCDGACWSLGGNKHHLAEIGSYKIVRARAAIARAKGR